MMDTLTLLLMTPIVVIVDQPRCPNADCHGWRPQGNLKDPTSDKVVMLEQTNGSWKPWGSHSYSDRLDQPLPWRLVVVYD
jgi:hypothetical protein